MKTELITAVVAAIAGVLIAFFVTNIFIGEIEDVTIKTVNSTVSTDLIEPDPEVFNNKALNPTVEVYVGDCDKYDSNNECIDQTTEEEIINLETTPNSGGSTTESNQENR